MSQQLVVTVAVLGLSLACVNCVSAQCVQTIPAAVERSRPAPLIKPLIAELVVRPLEQAVAESDLVVIGRLTKPRTYLSQDECTVYTDYVFTITRIVAGAIRDPLDASSANLTIRTWGGELSVGGVQVKVYQENVRELSPGIEYIMFLKLNQMSGKYEIFDQGAYALEIDGDDRAKPRVPPGRMSDVLEGVPVEDAIKAIRAITR